MHDATHPRQATGALLPSYRWIMVVAWAVVVTIVMIAHNASAQAPALMSSRAQGVASAIDVLDHGGPPLAVSDVPYHPGIAVSHLFPAGAGDDQGIYLYLPLLGHWTGEHDPGVLMKWLFTGCFALLVLLMPLLVYALFGSLAASAVAPLLLLWKFDMTNSDLYWASAWIVLLAVPTLLLADRCWRAERRRLVLTLLAPLMVAAGFATSIRSQSGLPVAIAAVGIALLAGGGLLRRTRRDWLVRAGVAAALVVAYVSVSLVFAGVRAYRDSQVHLVTTPNSVGTSHPFWHPAYLGLGYLPNKYGITWNDSVAADAVERARPGTQYLSAAYERTLRHLYLRIVENDPVFALRTYVTKARVVLADALRQFWLLGVLLAAALALGRTRGVTTAFWLTLPALLTTLAAPVMTIPSYAYDLGWLGAVGVAWLLAIAWALGWAEGLVRRSQPVAQLDRLRGRRRRGALAAAALVLVATVLAAVAKPSVASSITTYESATPFVRAPATAHAAASWRFRGGAASGWRVDPGAQLQRDFGERSTLGVHVTTPVTPQTVALSSPTVDVGPGRYMVVGHVRVLVGGLAIQAVDARTGSPLATGDYWYWQGDYLSNAVGTTFSVDGRTAVRVSLANWTSIPQASAWVLWDFRLVRLGATAQAVADRFYRAAATPLTAASALRGPLLAAWPFSGGTPQGWQTVGGPQQSLTTHGLDVRTTPQRSAYQLVGPPMQLPPGRYAAVVGGRVVHGGLEVGVLDDSKNAWITTRHFYDAQRFGGPREIAAVVTLTAPTRIRVILSNWAPGDVSSEWVVGRIRLLRLP